ncbi:MAG: lysophospholipid acyltransferase family protein [Akkermansia sp.]
MIDIRGKQSRWWTKIAGFGMWSVIQLICMTLRLRSEKEREENMDEPAISVCWHNRIFACGYAWVLSGWQKRMCILTSASKDGALLESILKHFDMTAVRGSTHRRSTVALVGMIQALKEGKCVSVTPDGPKGPIYRLSPGVIKMASISGVPIAPICIEYANCWRVKSWDRFCIPKPFSEARILWKKRIFIPRELNDEELESYRLMIENLMKEGLPDFSPLNFFSKQDNPENYANH